MSFSFNGISTAVTISGTVTASVPQPSSSQTLVAIELTGAGAADGYTVPASKTFYLMGWAIAASAAASKEFYMYKNDASTIVVKATTATATDFRSVTSVCPIHTWAAGEIVKIYATDNTIRLSFWGYVA